MPTIKKNFLSSFHKSQKKPVWSPALQYFKDCPLPLSPGNFTDIDRYDLQPLSSDDKVFLKEAMEIIVKA